jgi:hypothetical protein
LAKLKTDPVTRMITTLREQPGKISPSITKFPANFEKRFGITRWKAAAALAFSGVPA